MSDHSKVVQVRDLRSGNWFWIHNCILDHYVADGLLTPGEALVYFALCRISRDGVAEEGIPQIAHLAGAKDRFTRSAIGKLESVGLIAVERRQDSRGQLPNCYELLTPPALRTGGDALDNSAPLHSGQGGGALSAGTPIKENYVKDLTNTEDSNKLSTFSSKLSTTTEGDRGVITRYIKDLAVELHDEAPLPSSVGRAVNLFAQSGLGLDAFCDSMLEARRRTQQNSGRVTKPFSAERGGKPKMAYFFAILDEIVTEDRRADESA